MRSKVHKINSYINLKSLNEGLQEQIINELIRDNNQTKKEIKWQKNMNTLEVNLGYNFIPTINLYEGYDINKEVNGLTHSYIIGENYNVMRALCSDLKRKFGLIYLDLPYDTGTDFVFSGKVVNETDTWGSAKWCEFVYKRLVITRELLSSSGVVAMSITANHLGDLLGVCDEIFGHNNQIAIITVVTQRGGNMGGGVKKATEYLVVYALSYDLALEAKGYCDEEKTSKTKNFCLCEEVPFQRTVKDAPVIKTSPLKKGDTKIFADSTGPFSLISFKLSLGTKTDDKYANKNDYTIYYYKPNMGEGFVDTTTANPKVNYDFHPYFSLTNLGNDWVPITCKDSKGKWRWVQESFKQKLVEYNICDQPGENNEYAFACIPDFVVSEEKGEYTIQMILRDSYYKIGHNLDKAYKAKAITTLWDSTEYSSASGTRGLREYVPNSKLNAKPVALLKDIITAFAADGELIGDFFAGTGTMLQAVTEINETLDRNHRLIMCDTCGEESILSAAYTRMPAVLKDNPHEKLKLYYVDFIEIEDEDEDEVEDLYDAYQVSYSQMLGGILTNSSTLVFENEVYWMYSSDPNLLSDAQSTAEIVIVLKEVLSPVNDTLKTLKELDNFLKQFPNTTTTIYQYSFISEPTRPEGLDNKIKLKTYPEQQIKNILAITEKTRDFKKGESI